MPDSDGPLDRQLELLERKNERLRIKLSFWKFIFGTVAASVLTAVLNWQIQDRKLDHEIINKENEFIARFVDRALDDSPERRRDFAEYFFRLTPSEDARERWKEYRSYTEQLVRESIDKQLDIDATEQKLEALREAQRADAKTNDPELASRLAELETELSQKRQELSSLRSETSAGAAGGNDFSLASEREREGFKALLDGDVERSIAAFEAAERAFPTFHQVYEIGRLLRRHRSEFDNTRVRRDVLREIVERLSWKAPTDLLDEIRAELRRLEGGPS